MLCPDDGCELTGDAGGVSSCELCRGRAVSGEAFARIHRDLRELLRVEPDRESGAYARTRGCPRCGLAMLPLRMAELAWLDSCEACDLLWVEKLDEAVIERLERRRAVTRAVESLPVEDRREMARDLAREAADEERGLRAVEAVAKLLGLADLVLGRPP